MFPVQSCIPENPDIRTSLLLSWGNCKRMCFSQNKLPVSTEIENFINMKQENLKFVEFTQQFRHDFIGSLSHILFYEKGYFLSARFSPVTHFQRHPSPHQPHPKQLIRVIPTHIHTGLIHFNLHSCKVKTELEKKDSLSSTRTCTSDFRVFEEICVQEFFCNYIFFLILSIY